MTKNFAQTSDLPYNRHDYKLIFKNGKTMEFDNWEDAQVYWFQWISTNQLDYFEVLDKNQFKIKSKLTTETKKNPDRTTKFKGFLYG